MRPPSMGWKNQVSASRPRQLPTEARKRGTLRIILTLSVAILLSTPIFSQVVGGAISGAVRDQTGAVLPGAAVSTARAGS